MEDNELVLPIVSNIPDEHSFLDGLMEHEDIEYLYQCLSRLDAREQYVLSMLYRKNPLTKKKIGEVIGRTGDTVARIERMALSKLKTMLTNVDMYSASIGHLHDYEAYPTSFEQRYIDECGIELNILIDYFADNVCRVLGQELIYQLICLENDIYAGIGRRLTNDPYYLYRCPQGYTNEEIKDMVSAVYRILRYWNRYYIDGYRLFVKKDELYVVIDGVKYHTVSIFKKRSNSEVAQQRYKLFKTDHASLFEKTYRSSMDLFGNFCMWYERKMFLDNIQILNDTVKQIVQSIILPHQKERTKEK